MLHLYNFFIIALILINLAGLTAAAGKWLPHYAIARAGSVLILAMGFFFVEHFFGLGDLSWAWPFTTLAALYVLYRRRHTLHQTGFHWAEVAFLLGFAYSMLWRYLYPDINVQSERITDLYFINNYLDGAQLPPDDKWHYPYSFDFYYAFMHYSAAFMGRLFGLSGGYTYNIAYALIQASTIALAWHFSKTLLVTAKALTGAWYQVALEWLNSRWKPLLLTLVMVLGGTGVSPFMPFMVDKEGIHQSDQWYQNAILSTSATRFIGNFDTDWLGREAVRQPIADVLLPELDPATLSALQNGELSTLRQAWLWAIHPEITWQGEVADNWQPREMPAEIFSYQYYVGDYHPPLAGFFLLLILLACMAVLERERDNRPAQAIMALTVPAIFLSNTWVLPLHGILCLAWAGYRHWRRVPPNWPVLLGAGLLGFVLIYPFMTHFADRSLSTPFGLVAEIDRTPLNRWLLLFWPLLLLSVLGFFDKANRKLYMVMSLTVLALLVITEVTFVDDPNGGKSQRTNSTMKWWGYLWVAGIMMLGGLGLAAKHRWQRGLSAVVLASLLAYAPIMLTVALGAHSQPSLGQLNGHHWLDRDPTNRDKLDYLQALPKGVVLESADKYAYSTSGVMALFANQPLSYGWYNHYITWHGHSPHLGFKYADSRRFYQGNMAEPLNWLRVRGVDYISWMPRDNRRVSPSPWARVYDQIKDEFYWQPFYENGTNRVGLFVRKSR